MVHTWPKDYLKFDGHDVEPVHVFLSGSGGTGKFHLVKIIYNAISKSTFYRCKAPEKPKPRVRLLGPTGTLAVNIVGTTIHTGLGIKSRTKLLGLNGKSKAALRNGLSEAKFLIIEELYMVSSRLWKYIDSRLGEMFMMIPEKTFAALPVMIVADLLQLAPVREKIILSQFSDNDSMKYLLGLQF